MKFKEQVYCTLSVEGTHNWPNCPFEEVSYLRVPHRHLFGIKAYKQVTHSDRDVEFIMLKHQIGEYLKGAYHDPHESRICEFGAMSCEMIAQELIKEFDLIKCEVNEDGENGAIVEVDVDATNHEKQNTDIAAAELKRLEIQCPICGDPKKEGCKTC